MRSLNNEQVWQRLTPNEREDLLKCGLAIHRVLDHLSDAFTFADALECIGDNTTLSVERVRHLRAKIDALTEPK